MKVKVPREPGMTRDLIFGTNVEAPLPVLPHFILVGTAVVHGPGAFAPHRHDHYEVVLVQSGRYGCRVNGRHLRLDAGDVLVLKPGDVHEDLLTPPLNYVIVHFSLPARDSDQSVDIFMPGSSPVQRCLRKVSPRLFATYERLAEEGTSSDGFAMVMEDALIAIFLVDLLRCIPPALLRKEYRPGDRLGGFAEKLTRMFSEHSTERLDLATMAAHLGITQRSLIHQCRKELSTSPAHAFTAFKIDRALVLLRETTMSIGDISRCLGFESQFHFSKVFKRVHGKPPTRMRR
jgi:AraC-like DNA-binding protein